MYNPLSSDPFGTSPAKRRARVGDRLGCLARKFLSDPLLLSTVNAKGGKFCFIRAGLLLRTGSTPREARVEMIPSGYILRARKGRVGIYGGPVVRGDASHQEAIRRAREGKLGKPRAPTGVSQRSSGALTPSPVHGLVPTSGPWAQVYRPGPFGLRSTAKLGSCVPRS